MKRIVTLTALLLFVAIAQAQVNNPVIVKVASDPTGNACTNPSPLQWYAGTYYGCDNTGHRAAIGGGGSSVTFAGDLSGDNTSQTVVGINGAATTGNHGTATEVQRSDGTGTSGVCFFASDGSCTATPGDVTANSYNGVLLGYNVSSPDQVTLDSTQDASTTFYSVSAGKTDMVAASGGTAELVLGDPVNGTSIQDSSANGMSFYSAFSLQVSGNGGMTTVDNNVAGIVINEQAPTGSVTLQSNYGPVQVIAGTTFQVYGNSSNVLDFGVTTPNVLTLVAPVLTSGAEATTGTPGAGGTNVATQAYADASSAAVVSQGTISAGPGLFGASALNTVIAGTEASQAGHFTNLQVIASLGGTCTTPPQFNVFDGTSNTGTAVTATSTTQTKGNATVQAQTRTFSAGDQIGIYISTAGVTCTTDSFVVTAQYSTP